MKSTFLKDPSNFAASQISITKEQGFRWEVLVNDVALEGSHNDEAEAIERAINVKIKVPTDRVTIKIEQTKRIDVL